MSDRSEARPSGLVPAQLNQRVRALFAWYAERLMRKRFAAVHMAQGSERVLQDVGDDRGRSPTLLVMSHAAWWDPIVGAILWRRYFPRVDVLAPMDARELARFRFMRNLGLFGIDPDEPSSCSAMTEYLAEVWSDMVRRSPTDPRRLMVMITPQGRFTDPRLPVVARPGAAAVASRLGVERALAVAIEYAFWNEKNPEVFLRATSIEPPSRRSLLGWQRSIADTMEANRLALSDAVIARDPAAFTDLLSKRSGVHPVYDLWLRLTGRGRGIETDHRRGPSQRHASIEATS
jgi:1-acyl-sn-glycerol-3-phosphate acyltransferase